MIMIKKRKNIFWLFQSGFILVIISILFGQILNAQNNTIDSLHYLLKKSKSNTEEVRLFNKLSLAYLDVNIDSAIFYSNKAIQKAQNKDTTDLAETWFINARLFHYQKQIELALISYDKSLKLFIEDKDSSNISKVLTKKGYIYDEQGKFIQAIQCYKDANLYRQNLPCLINIANIHNIMRDNQKAMEYLLQAQKFNVEKLGNDIKNNETIYHLIGMTYLVQGNFEKAIIYTKRSLQNAQKLSNTPFIAHLHKILGNIYTQQGNIEEALANYDLSLTIYKCLFDSIKLYSVYEGMSVAFLKKGNTNKAIELAKMAYNKGYHNSAEILSKAYARQMNYKEAYLYLKEYKRINDSIRVDSVSREISLIENNYKHEEELKNIVLLQKQKEYFQQEELKRQKIIRNASIIGLILFMFIVFLFWRSNLIKQKANKQLDEQNEKLKAQQAEISEKNKELDHKYGEIKIINDELNQQKKIIEERNIELNSQNEEITTQRDMLASQNQSISESILYAKRIQTAVLPQTAYIDEILPENFILYRPRDVVSGDFYWVRQINQYIVIVVADCTGHGVPGAIMSMLGISFLNEIVQKREITQANQVLNELRKQIKQALKQTGREGGIEDGMDIALCVLDTKTNMLQYAGANNPLYLVQKNELIEIPADHMPIGFYPNEKPSFTNHEIQVREGAIFYLFTDGFIDQFGGEKGMKFKATNFQKILTENHNKPMQMQKEKLEQELADWMKGFEQTDDILVMGARV